MSQHVRSTHVELFYSHNRVGEEWGSCVDDMACSIIPALDTEHVCNERASCTPGLPRSAAQVCWGVLAWLRCLFVGDTSRLPRLS
jgi:hypothetical protein